MALFCVKSFDTEAVAARLGPLVGEDTAVVSLQTAPRSPSRGYRHTGGPASITFGEPDGRPMELEALHGFVVRRAAQHHSAVPTSETVYATLQSWAIRNQHASSRGHQRSATHGGRPPARGAGQGPDHDRGRRRPHGSAQIQPAAGNDGNQPGTRGIPPRRPGPRSASTAVPRQTAADQRRRCPSRYFSSCRAMTTRWIWFVPS